jgi:short-subunit dehydrogenase
MLQRDRGGVLNVASTAAFQPGPYMSVYYASKAFVLSFSEGIAEEVAGTNVTVTCLAPGPTDTPFFERADMDGTALTENGLSMTAAAVAQNGYDAFRRGLVLTIPGASNQLGAFLTRFIPRPLIRKIAAWLHA